MLVCTALRSKTSPIRCGGTRHRQAAAPEPGTERAIRVGVLSRVSVTALDPARRSRDHMRTDLVQGALAMSVAMRGELADEVIMHVGRGSQFTSGQLARFAREHNLVRSVGHTGDNTGTARKPNHSGPQ